ncbi:MAG: 16S rRNA (uracil(1498)-N(3))-methyltransferase [Syntrophaceae bacterium]|nr:16S rRNA (uracil(1498)-N(3))-methyltransferase [Syntrophaceae bacterium]
MPRFYVPDPQIEKDLLKIRGNEARHILRVLRLKLGDEIMVFDGLGNEFEGTIVEEASQSVVVKVKNIFSSKRESPIEITMAQSLLKGEKMDTLIQKATELGVNKIIPFVSSRSIPLLEKQGQLIRHHRWERIAIESSKQCGRGVIPRIEFLRSYSEMLQMVPSNSLRLILWERKGVKLKEVLEQSKRKPEIFFIVGPEGGFNEREIEESQRAGFITVHLGKRVLRAETASLCFLCILQYDLGDIG